MPRPSLLPAVICILALNGLRAGVPEGPFQDVTFEQALALAAQDKRVVLVDFFTTWCGPCKMLDQTTWKDREVIAFLAQKTVALKIDAELNSALARRFAVEAYPTILLVGSDGQVLDRLVGYQDPTAMLASLKGALAGSTTLMRARRAVADAPKDDREAQVEARFQLSRALAKDGEQSEALKEDLWLFDVGMKAEPSFFGVRLSYLLSDIVRLGRTYPPALEALRQRRDASKARFQAAPDAREAGELDALNRELREPSATLALYDQYAPGSAGQKVLGRVVWTQLIAKHRYIEAAAIKPLKAFQTEWERWAALVKDLKQTPEIEKMNQEMYLGNALLEVEALAGAGDLEDAASLAAQIQALDPGNRSRLAEHLQRAGHAELLGSADEAQPASQAKASGRP